MTEEYKYPRSIGHGRGRAGAAGAHGAWRVGSRSAAGLGERVRKKKRGGSGGIEKLGVYVPRPAEDSPYVPQLPDLADEYKSLRSSEI
jgi:hypothetical protein